MFREAVLAFMGVKDEDTGAQGVLVKNRGEYCKGVDLEACRRYFGEAILERVCATCPN
ncbi:hypothetical protein KSU1_C1510 [Candidatus Jettenia caeni]|uniref:Uncharacterized protein n=1 Tax=Candidatus Jettenia caeni TaxID=247490 RepID=I3IN11_9BACT|nr:hypothetical protein KSU1_C1510 [Candidatus Jettenia caeni]GJQ44257.1 MAG: hypothetical protein JETCAE04_00110 [Candidatus Jettenia caeni]